MKSCHCPCVCQRGQRVQDLEAKIQELEHALEIKNQALFQAHEALQGAYFMITGEKRVCQ